MNVSARLASALVALVAASAQAGGPLVVCGSGNTPVTYPSPAITLNYDLGTLGARTKDEADAIVAAAVSIWTDVDRSSVQLLRGADLAVDVTAANYLDYVDNYTDGLNPVIYDTDGAIIDALLGAGSKESVLGIARSTYYGPPPPCQFVEGHVILNGYLAATDAELRAKIAHEVGHLIGLDHAQLGSAQGLAPADYPLMHPLEARADATLHEDDAAAVSALYPHSSLVLTYGQVNGRFVLANGVSPVQGANMWARETTTGKLYSAVSDMFMNATGGFKLLLPDGVYTLHAEAILPVFTGELSVGPWADPPFDLSFRPPMYVDGVPMAALTMGNATPIEFRMNHGCTATVVFRIDGTGSVAGDCEGTAPPDAPVIGTATGGPGQISVTFTPGDLHGATVVEHRASCDPDSGGGTIATGAASPVVVSGLASGVLYRCRVMTQTPRGTSPWSEYSNWAMPILGPPQTPTIGVVTASAGQISVSFTPGNLNGGLLVAYEASCTTATGSPTYTGSSAHGSPVTVSGVAGGLAYHCRVRAVTSLGTSPWSSYSGWAYPPGLPDAPVLGAVVAGPAQVTINFTPGDLHGGTLVHHHASCVATIPAPTVFGYGTASPIAVTGLTSGIAYRCSVQTLTNVGYGGHSGISSPVTPTNGPPARPLMGGAMAGPAQLTVHFTPGSLNGGTLVHHEVSCRVTGAATRSFVGYGSGSPIVVTGMVMGYPSLCWVRTVSNLGIGAWSDASNLATPTAGPPAAPTIGTATPGSLQLSVTFTPGPLNGGLLSHHQVTCVAASGPARAFDGYGAASPIVVSGLAGGVAHRCWARTVTTLGTGPWSSGATNWATPTSGPPARPTAVTATAGPVQLSVAFTPGSLNGGVLTHHQATCYAGYGASYVGYGAASPIVIAGMPSGIPYLCWVRTVTSLGTSAWSIASNWATPDDGPPGAPLMGTATAGAGQVSVAFTPGSLNGGVLTHHHVTCATATAAYNGYGASSPVVVAGLTSGTAYRCWARTVTSLGTSAWSGVSNYATPS